MSWCRSLLLPGSVGLAALLTGALGFQTAQPARLPAPSFDPAASADPAATALLIQALEAFDPRKVPWIETKFYQRSDTHDLSFRAEGTYLTGPNYRLRLDLKVRAGLSRGQLRVTCDGKMLWQFEQIGHEMPNVSRIDLSRVLASTPASGFAARIRDEFTQFQLFTGVVPLLQSLRDEITFTRQEPMPWQGRDTLCLTGHWSQPRPPLKGWSAFSPSCCRLYLDAQTRWPARIEWWGPAADSDSNALLLQMEFRDPVFHRPLPDWEFTFVPGLAKVTDLTQQLLIWQDEEKR